MARSDFRPGGHGGFDPYAERRAAPPVIFFAWLVWTLVLLAAATTVLLLLFRLAQHEPRRAPKLRPSLTRGWVPAPGQNFASLAVYGSRP